MSFTRIFPFKNYIIDAKLTVYIVSSLWNAKKKYMNIFQVYLLIVNWEKVSLIKHCLMSNYLRWKSTFYEQWQYFYGKSTEPSHSQQRYVSHSPRVFGPSKRYALQYPFHHGCRRKGLHTFPGYASHKTSNGKLTHRVYRKPKHRYLHTIKSNWIV